MGDTASELGYIRGRQEAMEQDLSTIKSDVKDLSSRMARLEGGQTHLADSIDELKAMMQDSSKQRVVVPPLAIPEPAPGPWAIAIAVLKHPATPMGLALVAVIVMAIVTLSAITNRDASTLIPGTSHAPTAPVAAPGG